MQNQIVRNFRDLIVWQKSYRLVLEIYRITLDFPKSEQFGLSMQMRRAAISIPSNIAEGYCRNHKAEFRQFLAVAYGSLSELETQYMLSHDLGFTQENENVKGLISEIGKMLYRMLHPLGTKR